MKEPQTKKIDDFNVIVSAWPARKAWRYQVLFGKIIGPSLKELGAALGSKTQDKSIMDSDLSYEKIGEAIANLFNNLSEDESEDLLLKCMSSVRVNNEEITPETFDVIFAGNLSTVYKIVGFVLEVNYGSFLGKSGIGQLLKKAQIA